ncbi:NAD(P)H-binding protein [Bradyrhizobium sp. USDA 4473]
MTQTQILVVGATGTVGRHVVRLLLESGQSVRVLTRDVARAKDLFGSGVTIFEGDLARPATLGAAFKGAAKVFVLAPPGPDLITIEAAAFAAARAARAQHLVYLSNFGAGTLGSADSLWAAHGVSEGNLRASGLAWTILRPTRFMPDTPFAWAWDRENGIVSEPLAGSKVCVIAPEDIAAVAARVLTTEGHTGQVYELTSEALTGPEIAQAITNATGNATTFVDMAAKSARGAIVGRGVPPFIADIMVEFFETIRAGKWYLTGTAEEILGRKPLTYDEWLRREFGPTRSQAAQSPTTGA